MMGAVLLTILKALLTAAGILLLLLIIVPVRYRMEASVSEEGPHEQLSPESLAGASSCGIRADWLLFLVRFSFFFFFFWRPALRILGIPVPLPERKKAEKDNENAAGRSGFSLRGLYDSIRKAAGQARRLKDFLQRDDTQAALRTAVSEAARILGAVKPRHFGAEGVAGLGDPFLTGRMMEVQGMLYPFTGGRIALQPYFGESGMEDGGNSAYINIRAHAAGRVFLPVLAVTAIRLFSDRDIRQLKSLYTRQKGKQAAYQKEKADG